MDHVDPECLSSVAPQQLEVATVQMHPYVDGLGPREKEESYCTRGHLLVMSMASANPHTPPYVQTVVAKKTKEWHENTFNVDNTVFFAGVSLEPIHNGALAQANPASTAKVAIAVGGVVSIAVPINTGKNLHNGDDVYVANKLVELKRGTMQQGEDWYVATLTSDSENMSDLVGRVVDNSMHKDGYIRVRLY